MAARHICPKCGARRVDSQLGLERSPEEYVQHLVEVFHEVKRVLRPEGVLFLVLGDSYAGSGKGHTKHGTMVGYKQRTNAGSLTGMPAVHVDGLKPKDLVGIPWMVAFALRADGWWLRSDIIWAKPNPMPESVTDRPTRSHEYVFLLTRSAKYYYDAEAVKEQAVGAIGGAPIKINNPQAQGHHGATSRFNGAWTEPVSSRNRRSVWFIATQPYSGAHFATFPTKLVEPCIKAGTSAKGCCPKCGKPWERVVESSNPDRSLNKGRNGFRPDAIKAEVHKGASSGGYPQSRTLFWRSTCECGETETVPCTVLDPFAGSGTTGQVAVSLGRHAVLIDLNPEYQKMQIERVMTAEAPLPGVDTGSMVALPDPVRQMCVVEAG